jgi:hypothetical protein
MAVIGARSEGRMARFLQFLERNPLTISVLVLLVCFNAQANCLWLHERLYYDPSFYVKATIFCLFCLSLCLASLINLIRAANRGYASQRCQLSVVILFFAFAGPILLGWRLVSYYL